MCRPAAGTMFGENLRAARRASARGSKLAQIVGGAGNETLMGTQQAQQQYESGLFDVVSVFILMHSFLDLQINASNDHVNRFSGVFLEVQETLEWSLHLH